MSKHFLLQNRLKFYSYFMKEKLMRYKHVIVIVLFLLAPQGEGFFTYLLNNAKLPIDFLVMNSNDYFDEEKPSLAIRYACFLSNKIRSSAIISVV